MNNYNGRKLYGRGYIGNGKYRSKIDGKETIYYSYWHSIFRRCYSESALKRNATYKDCFANEEIYCLQDFGEWFDNNYYEIEGEKMCLDKDILVKGNKEYSFDKMIFVPEHINTLFIKNNKNRGKYPIGVCYYKRYNKYMAYCNIIEDNCQKKKYLGYYETPEEAFLAYKQFKEQYIKQVADEYKGRIPDRLYEAMYKWEVEIDD